MYEMLLHIPISKITLNLDIREIMAFQPAPGEGQTPNRVACHHINPRVSGLRG